MKTSSSTRRINAAAKTFHVALSRVPPSSVSDRFARSPTGPGERAGAPAPDAGPAGLGVGSGGPEESRGGWLADTRRLYPTRADLVTDLVDVRPDHRHGPQNRHIA
jgi:hypothetical protein